MFVIWFLIQEANINTDQVATDDWVEIVVPRLAAGTELIGEYQGSGFQEPRYLIRRGDGQMIQISRLLFSLVSHVDGRRTVAEVATVLGDEFHKVMQPHQVKYLIDNHLRPAGIVTVDPTTGQAAEPVTMALQPDPLLALKFRVGVVSEHLVWRIAGLFGPMFWPPVILAMLASFVGFDALTIAEGGLRQIVPSTLALISQPTSMLLVMGSLVASAVFHECGHVSACRYGGARPGKMGIGLYLVWPALYSTVTDSYRLGRLGRLRTDLGGVYFNAVFITGMNMAYLDSRAPWLLVAVAALHSATAIQFLPMVRLDGYYMLSDLIGVPDLFSRIGPVLASINPRRPSHPRVRELKPWARRTVTVWVLIVVPSLLYWLIGFLIVMSRLAPMILQRLGWLAQQMSKAASAGHAAQATVAVFDMIVMLLPWLGSALLLYILARGLMRWVLAHWNPSRFRIRQP
jgi:putative peptide zinc metalloprotease protein